MVSEIKTFLLAMLPLAELRVALPVALTVFHLDWEIAFLISVIGNIIPVILILLFLGPIADRLSGKSVFFQRFFEWLFKRTRQKYDPKKAKLRLSALTTFVALPFPLTGGWTGAIIAFLAGIPFRIALPFISLGVIIAGIIVLMITKTGIAIEQYFGWKALLGALFASILIYSIFKNFKKQKI